MKIIEKLFGKKSQPQTKAQEATVADVTAGRSSGSQGGTGGQGPALLAEFDLLNELSQLGRFLKGHSQAEPNSLSGVSPSLNLSLEYKSLEVLGTDYLTFAYLLDSRYSRPMSRIARIVVPGVPHYVTQRGNRRTDIFETDKDHEAYLRFLKHRFSFRFLWCPFSHADCHAVGS